jgi:ribosomal-protein-alanine N-acetyltransferase
MKETYRPLPHLRTERLHLRLGTEADLPAILRHFRDNSQFFEATDPPRPPGFLTEAFWRMQLHGGLQEFLADLSVRFFLFDQDDQTVLGTANFTQFMRGPFQACYLGYGLAQDRQGQGLMTEGLTAAIRYVFDDLVLHRIMANHLPDNHRSARVLERLGFVIEGRAKDYIRIGDEWRDHVLTSLVNPEWREN